MMHTKGNNYYSSSYGSAPFNSLPHPNYAIRPIARQTNSPFYKNSYQRVIPQNFNQPASIPSIPTYRLYALETNKYHDIIRLIFAYAGISYKDRRLKDNEWTKMKDEQAIDQLPILRINNDIKIYHLHAILRYLARDFLLYGTDKHEHALVDIVLEIIRPLEEKIIQEIDHEDNLRKIITDDIEIYLKQLENCYAIFHRHGPFFLGSRISLADLIVYHMLTYLIKIDSKLLDNYSHLKEARRYLQKHPKIFNYFNKTECIQIKSPTPNKNSNQQRHRSHDEHHNHHHHQHHHHHRHHNHHRRHSKEPTPSSQRKQITHISKSPSITTKTDAIPANLSPQIKSEQKLE